MIMIKYVDSGGQAHLVTNIRKPRKWRRFEYLQSSGTQYIDTGVNADSNLSVKFKFSPTSVSSTTLPIGAIYQNSSSYIRHHINNFRDYVGYHLGADPYYVSTSKYSANTDYEYDVDMQSSTITVNNQVLSFTNTTFNTNLNYWLFRRNSNSSGLMYYGSLKLYYFKMYYQGVLIRNFVPAQYNGEYGMWDLVEDKFYPNKGTGSFTVGPEIKNYDEIYEVRRSNSILPAGVELYDYIQSSGTQYIHIDNNSSIIKIKLDFSLQSNNSDQDTILTLNGNQCYLNKTKVLKIWNSNGSTGSVNYTFDTRVSATYELTSSKSIIQINEGTVESINKAYDSTGIYLFAYKNLSYKARAKLYSCQISENSVMIHNLLPCTYLGEPGMWDTVENKFYRNKGTGQFTLGNKITLKEYEYLQGNGSSTYINTNYYPNVNTKFIYKVSNPSSGSCTDGEINGTSATGHNFYIGNTQYAFDNTVMSGLALRKTTPFVAQIDKNGLYIDNVFVTRQTSYGSNWVSPRPFFLSALNRGSGIVYNTNKIYYCQFYENNQLVRDFIPVSYNGTPGLWDKVEWKFYANAGSGSFTLGPEKASGIYPVWTPIEYLQSTGTQYINTGHVLKNTDIVDVTYDNIAYGFVFGSRTSSSSQYSAITNEDNGRNTYNIRYGNTILYTTSPQPSGTVAVHIESGNTKINGSTVSTTTYGSNFYSGNCYLFTINNNGTAYSGTYGTNRIRRFSIQGACDMIPVRIGNIGYMFDKVTGKMFGNSGTGNFVLGPDINT